MDYSLSSIKLESSPLDISLDSRASLGQLSPMPYSEDTIKTYQAWAIQNYGDSGKTKTVTRRKYMRIKQILTGEEVASTDNSKFRFWVRAKGFKLGAPPLSDNSDESQVVYIPVKPQGSGASSQGEVEYRRVAVVEDFFSIIYGVHVEMEGRGGKHAGQKRTYRAIAETYSFLPREAVTRFLMSCSDCQKRMHLSSPGSHHETNNNGSPTHPEQNVLTEAGLKLSSEQKGTEHAVSMSGGTDTIDFSMPITTTYLNRLKASKKGGPVADIAAYLDDVEMYGNTGHRDEDSMSSGGLSQMSGDDSSVSSPSPASPPAATTNGPSTTGASPPPAKMQKRDNSPPGEQTLNLSPKAAVASGAGGERLSPTSDMAAAMAASLSSSQQQNGDVASSEVKCTSNSSLAGILSAGVTNGDDKSHVGRKRRHSSDSLDSSITKVSESNPDDTKDDDDNDDEDDDEKLAASQDVDPERLKAFNMFVRLFVDENLDRTVPISKQPKDKVQAILEACDRQFPEFHERSRKRVRTYLKSCRRMRRSKDSNGFEQMRPTPPHLTSAAAESILAQACENESQNAKRMRMGLEPLPAAVMNPHPSTSTIMGSSTPVSHQPPVNSQSTQHSPPVSAHSQKAKISASSADRSALATDYLRHMTPPPTAFRSPHDLPSPFFTNGGGSLFRPGFPAAYTPPGAHQHSSVLSHTALSSQLQNGPTDLSLKGKSSSASSSSPSKCQLNPNEMATIKQLIAGYRESAAFLYRSADELEQLLLQQN